MKLTIKHKNKPCKAIFHKYGDTRIKKCFCLFPKKQYLAKTDITVYYWLETVFIVYEWTEGNIYSNFDPYGYYVSDSWQRLGIATSYEKAVKKDWY
jgi:hypothetical protein